jgi:predicted GNAT superfamily acetyltransferase
MIDIREIQGIDELRAVEALQKEVWECPDLEVVPAYHMIA